MTIFFRKHFKAYSWFLELPILAAVYLKTIWGFLKVSVLKLFWKKISDEQVYKGYKFLVLTDSPEQSRAVALLRDKGYSPRVEGISSRVSAFGHSLLSSDEWKNFDFIVYDTDIFSYKTMIEAFIRQYDNNKIKKPSLAVYHQDIDKIITFSYVVQR